MYILIGILIGFLLGILFLKLYSFLRMRRNEKRGAHLIKCDELIREPVQIPIKEENSEILLAGEIYKATYTPSKAPYIIVLHGIGGYHSDPNIDPAAVALALSGYNVLGYDFRGYGQSPGKVRKGGLQNFLKIWSDLMQVITFVQQRKDLDGERIGLIGFSLGGTIALSTGYRDPRLKVIIGVCTAFDIKKTLNSWSWMLKLLVRLFIGINFTIPEEFESQISPKFSLKTTPENRARVFLAHCRDDTIVPFFNFEDNVRLLGLPKDNTIVFDSGGHYFLGKEKALVARLIYWFNHFL